MNRGKEPSVKRRTVLKVVPWFNKEEYFQVYQNLYSNSLQEKRWAVDRITVWKTRCFPTFPVGVEVTAALVRATIQDSLVLNELYVCNFEDVTLMYSMAIVRFTNLVCELKQTGEYSVPMRLIARKFDIPEWIIEIRNEVTHGRTPHLDKLRETSNAALSWLKNQYWENQLKNCVDFVPNNIKLSEETIRDTLTEYQKTRYMEIYSSKYLESNKRECTGKVRTSNVLSKLTGEAEKNKDLFINVLVQPEYLLSLTAATQPILTDDSFLEEETIDLPFCMEKFWKPIITVLGMKGWIGDLIIALLKCHSEMHLQNQRIAIAWIWKFLKSSVPEWNTEVPEETPVFLILTKYPQYLDWLRITTACLKNVSKYVPAILPILVKNADCRLTLEMKNRLMGLVAIFIGSLAVTSSNDDVKDRPLFNVDGVKTVLEMHSVVKKGEATLYYEENPWQLCDDDIDWESIPIGMVLGSDKGMGVEVLECSENASATEEEKQEQLCDVSMEFDTHIKNEDDIEYFNEKSFEENAAIEDFTFSNDQSNIISQGEDLLVF